MNFIQIKYKMSHSNNFWKYIFTYLTYFISFALYMIHKNRRIIDVLCKIKNEKTHNLVGVIPFSLKLTITVVPGLEKHVKNSIATYDMSYDGQRYRSIKDNNGDGRTNYVK